MRPPWRDDEPVELPLGLGEVIDLHTLTPRQQWACDFVGKWIGIGACYVIAGAIRTVRGFAWAVRRLRP